jgi:cell division protein FtsB
MRKVARGSDNGRSKLTAEQALDIHLQARSGQYWQREIAERFDVSQSEVSLLMHRRRWRFLFYNSDGNPMSEDELKAELDRLKAEKEELAARIAKLEKVGEPPAPFKAEPYQPRDWTAGATMDRETKRELAKAIPPDLARDLRADLARGNPIHQSVAQLTPPDRPGQVQIARGTNIVDPRPDDPPHGLVKGNQWGK